MSQSTYAFHFTPLASRSAQEIANGINAALGVYKRNLVEVNDTYCVISFPNRAKKTALVKKMQDVGFNHVYNIEWLPPQTPEEVALLKGLREDAANLPVPVYEDKPTV